MLRVRRLRVHLDGGALLLPVDRHVLAAHCASTRATDATVAGGKPIRVPAFPPLAKPAAAATLCGQHGLRAGPLYAVRPVGKLLSSATAGKLLAIQLILRKTFPAAASSITLAAASLRAGPY